MPDLRKWIDPIGYPCVAAKHARMGHWCGYVGVPADHPWFGLSYNSIVKIPKDILDRPRSLQGIGPINLLIAAFRGGDPADGIEICTVLEVHGGISWSDDYLPWGETDGNFWYGFDCAHAGDFIPGLDAMLGDVPRPASIRGLPRDLEYVTSECSSLAQQLADIAKVFSVAQPEDLQAGKR